MHNGRSSYRTFQPNRSNSEFERNRGLSQQNRSNSEFKSKITDRNLDEQNLVTHSIGNFQGTRSYSQQNKNHTHFMNRSTLNNQSKMSDSIKENNLCTDASVRPKSYNPNRRRDSFQPNRSNSEFERNRGLSQQNRSNSEFKSKITDRNLDEQNLVTHSIGNFQGTRSYSQQNKNHTHFMNRSTLNNQSKMSDSIKENNLCTDASVRPKSDNPNRRRDSFQHNRSNSKFERNRGSSQQNRSNSEFKSNKTDRNLDEQNLVTDCTNASIHLKSYKKYRIGYKALEKFLNDDEQADNILFELLNKNSGYGNLIKWENIRIDFVVLIFKILVKLCRSAVNKENLLDLLNITFLNSFINVISVTIMNYKKIGDAGNFFYNLHEVCTFFQEKRPYETISIFDNIINAIQMILNQDNNFIPVVTIFKELKEKIDIVKSNFTANENFKERNKKFLNIDDNLEPPDNFRNISVMPTIYDINQGMKPFLRRNIVEGKYNDVNHYLDIQFRLLREDFTRPLREGIEKFQLSQGKSYSKELKIYRGVKISQIEMVSQNFIYYIKLNLKPNLALENSKRLLYGNIVCFSNDNFNTIIFGYIADRSSDNLKKNLIGVKFESTPINLKVTYDMAESKAFFIAYKYVLEALQKIKENEFPLKHYIIDVSKELFNPSYLRLDASAFYDLRVIKYIYSLNIPDYFKIRVTSEQSELPFDPFLDIINIKLPLDHWPNTELLALDNSQRSALHSALNRQLAIIQGPPGTGKTFIGLKITQVLLHNSNKWNRKKPILVVCYTNHALDQFLEGILSFTTNIVRVGSRSKNEALDNYQLNKLAELIRRSNTIPIELQKRIRYLKGNIKFLENSIEFILNAINELKNPQGIFFLGLLNESIPKEYIVQLNNIGMKDWLLGLYSKHDYLEFVSLVNEPAKDIAFQDVDENSDENSDQEWHDAIEYINQSEKDRLLDEIIDSGKSKPKIDLKQYYIITLDSLEKQINDLKPESGLFDDYEQAYSSKLLSDDLEIMKIGLENISFNGINKITYKFIQENKVDLLKLSLKERWQCYKIWTEEQLQFFENSLFDNKSKLEKEMKYLTEVREYETKYIMENSAVVGMTTTCAAKYSQIIQLIQPEIVMIEEAAEILEAHVITCLTSGCKQLIMIGDHQQLKPSATVFELAKRYNLETSLFERMIKNGIHYDVLEYQHRMRPSISKLLVPNIYPNLKDHISVQDREHIRGMTKDVFFIDHNIHEASHEDDNNSHENMHEATFIMALCEHILLQGYKSKQITILAPYSGQFFLLRKIQRGHSICKNVKICVVDNFQGEENDIILLSLVRSNNKENIGFLKIENRVCVALSRAKNGFYIIGNMSQLCAKSDLWRNINKTLKDEESIASSITLKCINHDTLTKVSSPKQFKKFCPEGGCLKNCLFSFECGHQCPRTCHVIIETDHKKCRAKCNERLCQDENHLCEKECWQECGPCKYLVTKTLPCDHEAKLYCYLNPQDFKCLTMVERELPNCGHKNKMPCHESIHTWKCSFPCDTRTPCGHICTQKCHATVDPEHEKYKCLQKCDKNNKNCNLNHKCAKLCFEDCGKCTALIRKTLPCNHIHNNVKCYAEIVCNKTCNKLMLCGHHCTRMCCLPCGNCKVIVEKVVSTCGHKAKVPCGTEANSTHCRGSCSKILSCGHICQKKCKDICSDYLCQKLVVSQFKCPKHQRYNISIPCHKSNITLTKEDTWLLCPEICNSLLECGHKCKGKCGECFNGRIHQQCKETCNRQLVCGHICKFFCSSECPPCQLNCEVRCVHNACKNRCSIPCVPCLAPCARKCIHKKCTNKCRDKCSVEPCEQPCLEKLQCGHPCVGFCGDPCPPLCRKCDFEKLTEFQILSNEDEEDARFVLLKDCGHVIEADGLNGWLNRENDGTIGMKECPRCKTLIHNNTRYKDIIRACYLDVENVKKKYYSEDSSQKKDKIKNLLSKLSTIKYYNKECVKILKSVGMEQTRTIESRKKYSDNQIHLAYCQAEVIAKAAHIKENVEKQSKDNRLKHTNIEYLHNLLSLVIEMVLNTEIKISNQFMEEVICELNRIEILPALYKIRNSISSNSQLKQIYMDIKTLMHPSIKYDSQIENQVKVKLKMAERLIGGLGISNDERLMILKAMGLRQGHWYKCPNKHIYCITECGGAMQTAKCPECGAQIGGELHELRNDNSVASEMDGAKYAAWSEQANMQNYVY